MPGNLKNQEKIIKNLISYGLLESEAKAYCSTLALEEAPVDRIARHAGLNRTSSYPIFERLKAMGLVSQGKKKKKTVFKAVRPDIFLSLLEDKKDSINSILPDLKSIFDISRGKPGVSFFEGPEGLKTVMNTILNEAKEVCILGEGESFINAIPGWTESYVYKRASKNIKVRMILKASPYGVKSIKQISHGDNRVNQLLKVRMLPEAYQINYSGFDIYNNKVVLYCFEKHSYAMVIESAVISQMMKVVFDILWEGSEKYDYLFK